MSANKDYASCYPCTKNIKLRTQLSKILIITTYIIKDIPENLKPTLSQNLLSSFNNISRVLTLLYNTDKNKRKPLFDDIFSHVEVFGSYVEVIGSLGFLSSQTRTLITTAIVDLSCQIQKWKNS